MAAKDGAFRTLSALAAGSVAGVLTIIQSVSFAALIFSGPLSAHIPEGLGIALVTGAIVGLVGTLPFLVDQNMIASWAPGAGTALGELAFYLDEPRSASVIADTGCRLYKLTNAKHRTWD